MAKALRRGPNAYDLPEEVEEPFTIDLATPPPEVAAFAQTAPSDELRSAQRESDMLRFLANRGADFRRAASFIHGVPSGEPDYTGTDKPVEHVQQRQAEAYKVAQAEAAKKARAEDLARMEAKEAQRRKERGEDIERGKEEKEKDRRATITAASITGKGKAEADKAKQEGEIFDRAHTLRTAFNARPPVRQYEDALPARDVIAEGVKNPGAVSDMAMVYNFLQVLDPSAIVTANDAQNLAESGGLPEKLQSVYNNLTGGGAFSQAKRASILAQTEQLLSARKQRYDAERQRYGTEAERYGVDPVSVVGGTWTRRAPAVEAPRPQPAKGNVFVTNGKERLEIPLADLSDAEKDGYRRE